MRGLKLFLLPYEGAYVIHSMIQRNQQEGMSFALEANVIFIFTKGNSEYRVCKLKDEHVYMLNWGCVMLVGAKPKCDESVVTEIDELWELRNKSIPLPLNLSGFKSLSTLIYIDWVLIYLFIPVCRACQSHEVIVINGVIRFGLMHRFLISFGEPKWFHNQHRPNKSEASVSIRHSETIDSVTNYLGMGNDSEWYEAKKLGFLAKELKGKRPLIPPTIEKMRSRIKVSDFPFVYWDTKMVGLLLQEDQLWKKTYRPGRILMAYSFAPNMDYQLYLFFISGVYCVNLQYNIMPHHF
ncbi:Phosphoenolpyruvate carboxylase [Artemisia annua]|uniref:Phosphoenolpyruvate carboxylase n=1 Tax=Artemisia annua TaxID=35608 RepID=A0A2U1LVN5_ARTAN|nr:Phosphoenolpyruvate carboxylase [Artemisia annua]